MSTYLVGLLVSNFKCIEREAANAGPEGNLPVRICAKPTIPSLHLEYALDIAVRVIEYYEQLYDIKYPLPKCGSFYYKYYFTAFTFYSF